jgi:hypothetical protein
MGAAAIAATYLALVLPLTFRTGANLEEVAGLVPVQPLRHYPRAAADTPRATGLRLSDDLPVFGYARPSGAFAPLMVDGHVGALPFAPLRLALALGGLTAARLVLVLAGLVVLALLGLVATRLFGEAAGWLAAALAALWPMFVFLHHWARIDEQGSFAFPLAALFCLIEHRRRGRLRWFLGGAALFGLGIAAKNTVLWTLSATALAALVFRALPRVRARDWAAAALLLALPLAPQVLFLFRAPSGNALASRVARIPMPWHAFTPQRLAHFAVEFVQSNGAIGGALADYIEGHEPRGSFAGAAAGAAILLCVLAAVARAALRGTPRPARAFGLGLALLLVQYVAFYYTSGPSFFILPMPWVILALAGTLAAAAHAARGRRALRPAAILVGGWLALHQGWQTLRLERAAAHPDALIFHLQAQRQLADELVRAPGPPPWTMSYAIIGVLETLTGGRVQPEHAFPIFAEGCARSEQRLKDEVDVAGEAWRSVFARMGPGRHRLVLELRATPVEISPCRDGQGIAEAFVPSLAAAGGRMQALAELGPGGRPLARLVELELPAPGSPVVTPRDGLLP